MNNLFDAAFAALEKLDSVRYMWNGPIHQAAAILRDATGPQQPVKQKGEIMLDLKQFEGDPSYWYLPDTVLLRDEVIRLREREMVLVSALIEAEEYIPNRGRPALLARVKAAIKG